MMTGCTSPMPQARIDWTMRQSSRGRAPTSVTGTAQLVFSDRNCSALLYIDLGGVPGGSAF
jgi:hypothetical protein